MAAQEPDPGRTVGLIPDDAPPAARPAERPPHGGRSAASLVDRVAGAWRVALGAGEAALDAAGSCGAGLRFPPGELDERSRLLRGERELADRALAALARAEHVPSGGRLTAPRPTYRQLGLPEGVRALVFDLDGVLAPADALHVAAWADAIGPLLVHRLERAGERLGPVRPFDPRTDYPRYLHGRPRLEGIRAFLASRGIRLPEGTADDPPGTDTVQGLARRKAEALQRRLDGGGIGDPIAARRYLGAARELDLRCAVVSASAHAEELLERSGLADLVDACVDGRAMTEQRLRAEPAPDLPLAACRRLAVLPARAVAFETTADGVAAARSAGLAGVVGVDRTSDGLPRPEGADRMVGALDELLAA